MLPRRWTTMALALCIRTAASRRLARSATPAFVTPHASHQRCPLRRHSTTDAETSTPPPTTDDVGDDEERYLPPWSTAQPRTPSSKAFSRFRQHVNPLSRRFQMPADLPEQWPHSDFDNANLPLFLDIGCAKGGFLLELVGRRHGGREKEAKDDDYMNLSKDLFEDTTSNWLPSEMNYLGLEIRPGVSQYAQARVEKRGLNGSLSFVGCNANVDLGRLLTLYQESVDAANEGDNRPAFVSIQFPDPHFKKAHNKRRVVTPALVSTLAQFMKEGDVVFLQSDILDALEAMRERFVEEDGERYFDEWTDPRGSKGEQVYRMPNPLGVPTEREVSVLKQGLPIYRTLFKRNGQLAFDS